MYIRSAPKPTFCHLLTVFTVFSKPLRGILEEPLSWLGFSPPRPAGWQHNAKSYHLSVYIYILQYLRRSLYHVYIYICARYICIVYIFLTFHHDSILRITCQVLAQL